MKVTPRTQHLTVALPPKPPTVQPQSNHSGPSGARARRSSALDKLLANAIAAAFAAFSELPEASLPARRHVVDLFVSLTENVPTLLPDPWDRLLEIMMEDDSLWVTHPATIGSPESEKRATP